MLQVENWKIIVDLRNERSFQSDDGPGNFELSFQFVVQVSKRLSHLLNIYILYKY